MIAILSVSVPAAETSAAAMLRNAGPGVTVNRSEAPPSTALFTHDLIETPKGVGSRIQLNGSIVEIGPETMVEFEGDELVLDHGDLSVETFRGLRVRVGCVTLKPVNDAEETLYNVADRDGKVSVAAVRSDVYLNARQNSLRAAKQSDNDSSVVHQGNEKSRSESCGGDPRSAAQQSLKGPILDSPWAIGAGFVAVSIITCYALCQGGNPISPTSPK
jgi:hypothetical protein